MCATYHLMLKRDANPDVNYDDDIMADAADDTLNDAEADDDYAEQDTAIDVKIENEGEDFTLKVGDSVRLPCDVNPRPTATNGIVLSWKKDESLYYLGNVRTELPDRITRENDDLIIRNVSQSDVGKYKCEITGSNTFIIHTVSLNGPAKVIDVTATNRGLVVEDSDVVITCHVEGSPPPTVIWSRETANRENVRLTEKDVEFSYNSITIRKIARHQAGKYICYADNKIGQPHAKHINIKVVGKPRVHVPRTVINTKPGVEAIIQCSAHEEPEAHIHWYKDGRPVQDVEFVFSIRTEGQNSNLTITPRIESDFGTYTCEAENSYGKHMKSIKLVQEPIVEDVDVDGPKLSWTVHSHQPLETVELQLRNVNDSQWQKITVPLPEDNEQVSYHMTHEIKDIEPGQYEAHVKVNNGYSWNDNVEPVLTKIEAEFIAGASVFGGNAHSIRPPSMFMSSIIMYILIRLF